MKLKFYKYQGAGNDFILFDNRAMVLKGDETALFAKLCDRRFGIGADGVMLLQNHDEADFEMVYFNADGCESSMCGNGGRCIVNFARQLGIRKDNYKFLAVDGMHEANQEGEIVYLKMNDVNEIVREDDHYILDTGSPHYVTFASNLKQLDVKKAGAAIRYSDKFKADGININFLEIVGDENFIRTYERGVEDETLSCGTGVTASALIISLHQKLPNGNHELSLQTMGGELKVRFEKINDHQFKNIWLIGPGEFVFEGEIEVGRNNE